MTLATFVKIVNKVQNLIDSNPYYEGLATDFIEDMEHTIKDDEPGKAEEDMRNYLFNEAVDSMPEEELNEIYEKDNDVTLYTEDDLKSYIVDEYSPDDIYCIFHDNEISGWADYYSFDETNLIIEEVNQDDIRDNVFQNKSLPDDYQRFEDNIIESIKPFFENTCALHDMIESLNKIGDAPKSTFEIDEEP